VTINGVWIGNRIYCARTLNYNWASLDSLQLTTEYLTTESLTTTTEPHNSNWLWVSSRLGPGPPADPLHSLRTVDSDCSASDLLAKAQNLLSQTDSLNSSLKTEDLTDYRLVSGLYSLGTDRRENTSSEQTPKETPIVACLAVTKDRVLPLLTRQAYSVHVRIWYCTFIDFQENCIYLQVFVIIICDISSFIFSYGG
jgi:hypothetical protein